MVSGDFLFTFSVCIVPFFLSSGELPLPVNLNDVNADPDDVDEVEVLLDALQ